MQYFINMINM